MALGMGALSVAAAGTGEKEQPKKKEIAVKLTVKDLPPAVKATLQEQVGDGKIVEVKQMTKKGRVVYHADLLTNGKDWEIDVVADGTLLKNKAGKSVDDGGDIPATKCKDDCEYRKEAPSQCEKSCPMMRVKPSNK